MLSILYAVDLLIVHDRQRFPRVDEGEEGGLWVLRTSCRRCRVDIEEKKREVCSRSPDGGEGIQNRLEENGWRIRRTGERSYLGHFLNGGAVG